jgi:hypothetical protein
MKRLFSVLVLWLFLVLPGSWASAAYVDLATFTTDVGVVIDPAGGLIAFTEQIDKIAIGAYDHHFQVPYNAGRLSYDYSLALGPNNEDRLVTLIDCKKYETRIGIKDTASGSWVIDVTPYQGQIVSLIFGLEANDFGFGLNHLIGTSAKVSNLTIVPVPIPASLTLLGSGLISLFAVAVRKKMLLGDILP